ncbi:Coiled-coil domain-containing protein 6 [Geodia barretti]|uniref:Coiled-coil domain-containing protein 6 n=1 Tax=Geodia barretti TaxID=519541 RepID=A0AA35WRA9_GEOBA|nr:Coiled-coil domain-containing protein 6 [Geodia barretti]
MPPDSRLCAKRGFKDQVAMAAPRPCSKTPSMSSLQATQSSSMESLESSMSTSEVTTGEAESARLATVLQENAVLKSELEILKLKCRNLHEENRRLRKPASILREKAQLEQTLEQEQEQQISKLTKKIGRLEKDVLGKQSTLEKLRREKIDLENTLEQEQEMLVNKLWKRIEKVEQEKRELEAKLGATPPPSPSDRNSPALLTSRIAQLSAEVDKLRRMLQHTETQNREKVQQITDEERMCGRRTCVSNGDCCGRRSDESS